MAETKIEIAKEFANKQVNEYFESGCYDNSDMVCFEHEGQIIINPWLSSCARFIYTDAKAVEVYGLKNVIDFIERVVRKVQNE